MRVRLNIGLDFDGNHTFAWQASHDPGAVDIPRTTLDRWTAEREAFAVAYRRWRKAMEEIEDTLYHAESQRTALPEPAVAVATTRVRRR